MKDEHKSIKNLPSNKTFGLFFGVLAILFSAYFYFFKSILIKTLLLIGVALIILSFLKPKILYLPNYLWFKFGITLGKVISPIVLALIYYLAVTPTGIFLRIFGKDNLDRKYDYQAETYWKKRDVKPESMQRQF